MDFVKSGELKKPYDVGVGRHIQCRLSYLTGNLETLRSQGHGPCEVGCQIYGSCELAGDKYAGHVNSRRRLWVLRHQGANRGLAILGGTGHKRVTATKRAMFCSKTMVEVA